MSELNIREADRLEITVLMDNYTDIFLIERLMYADDLSYLFFRRYFSPNTDFRA